MIRRVLTQRLAKSPEADFGAFDVPRAAEAFAKTPGMDNLWEIRCRPVALCCCGSLPPDVFRENWVEFFRFDAEWQGIVEFCDLEAVTML